MSEKVIKQLVVAIINQAVKDWEKADKQLTTNPTYRPAVQTKGEISEFFQGDWFAFLCEIHADYASRKLQEIYV